MTWIRNFFALVYETLFGCRHAHLTRPFTLQAQTYKVCLECGRQVFYSLETMRPLSAREVRRMHLGNHGPAPAVKIMPATAAARQAIAQRAHKSNAAA